MKPALRIIDVTKSYFVRDMELSILRGISLDIEEGEFLAIIGPSGSGKSTLLHLMGGLDRPSTGTISIEGQDLTVLDDEGLARLRNERIGFVFQNFFLLNYYSALENVSLPLVYAGGHRHRREEALELLEQVGLGHRIHHRPNELSGGERQRVAIARALINSPNIIFADEPTGNLDTKTGEIIMEILGDINRKGKTLILITHDPHIARRAHRVIHIEDGLIL